MALLIGDHKELILCFGVGRGPKKRVVVVCMGRKRHYRKDGTCKHVAGLLEVMRPWYRSRTDVTLWGNKPPTPARRDGDE